jgi:hypothetical protein
LDEWSFGLYYFISGVSEMKLRWIEREEFVPTETFDLTVTKRKVKVLQYWDKDYFDEGCGFWVDVPLEVEEFL